MKTHPYMNERQSKLYDQVKDSADAKDQEIKRLLEELAAASRAAHCASRY